MLRRVDADAFRPPLLKVRRRHERRAPGRRCGLAQGVQVVIPIGGVHGGCAEASRHVGVLHDVEVHALVDHLEHRRALREADFSVAVVRAGDGRRRDTARIEREHLVCQKVRDRHPCGIRRDQHNGGAWGQWRIWRGCWGRWGRWGRQGSGGLGTRVTKKNQTYTEPVPNRRSLRARHTSVGLSYHPKMFAGRSSLVK